MPMPVRVHVLQHVPFEGLGAIADWLQRRHADVTWTRFFASPQLPAVAAVDFVIALGGPMSVNDEEDCPWLAAEKRFLAEAIAAGKAVLGICLGAQLIASALGARVYRNPLKEIGWLPIRAEAGAGGGFAFPPEATVFHWHGETFDLPGPAVLLAGSAACRHQAFQVGRRVLGLQFHLETTPATVEALLSACAGELVPQRFVQTAQQMRAVPPQVYADLNHLLLQVLDYLAPEPLSP